MKQFNMASLLRSTRCYFKTSELFLVLLSMTVMSVALADDNGQGEKSWRFYGGNIHNTKEASSWGDISPETVEKRGFKVVWNIITAPEQTGHRPASIVDDKLYFTTNSVATGFATGKIYAVDTKTGNIIFSKVVSDYSADIFALTHEPVAVEGVQNTPLYYNGNLIFQTRDIAHRLAPLYFYTNSGGSYVLSVNATTGSLNWATKTDDHPGAEGTASFVINDGIVYTGVGGPDYVNTLVWPLSSVSLPPPGLLPADENYSCCNMRGAVLALNANTGKVLWKTYTTPPAPKADEPSGDERNYVGPIGIVDPLIKPAVDRRAFPLVPTSQVPTGVNSDETWYAGASVWGSNPVVDKKRGLLYVGSGNNSTVTKEARLCEKQRRGTISTDEATELGDRLTGIATSIGADAVVCDAPTTIVLTDMASAAGKVVGLNDAFLSTTNVRGERSYGNYADSLIALDLKTGEIRWAFRSRPYDSYTLYCDFVTLPSVFGGIYGTAQQLCPDPYGFDADFGQAPMLVSSRDNKLDLVVGATKGGFVYAVNANDGTFYQDWGKPIHLSQLAPLGGSEWGSAADSKRMYVKSAHMGNMFIPGVIGSLNDPMLPPNNATSVESVHEVCHSVLKDDERVTVGGQRIEVNGPRFPNCKIVDNFNPNIATLDKTVAEYLSAIDLKTGEVLWQYADPSGKPCPIDNTPCGDSPRSFGTGGMSVANDVVFTGNQLGVIRFHNAKSGTILREINLNGTDFAQMAEAAPSIVGNRVYLGTGPAVTNFTGDINNSFTNLANTRLLALELCPLGTHADPDDITKCAKDKP